MCMAQNINQTDPHSQSTQIALLAQRVSDLGRQKEELERHEKALEARVQHLEALFNPERLKDIDNAIKFMSNAEFMGKWTWRGIYGFIILSGGFFAAFKFWKGN